MLRNARHVFLSNARSEGAAQAVSENVNLSLLFPLLVPQRQVTITGVPERVKRSYASPEKLIGRQANCLAKAAPFCD